MAENPLRKIARLLTGVALMQGRLGHQVLGQLLVAGTSEPAIAGAAVVIAASSRQKNAVAQVALRTAAPALVVHGLMRQDAKRIERRAAVLARREEQLKNDERKLLAAAKVARPPARRRRRRPRPKPARRR